MGSVATILSALLLAASSQRVEIINDTFPLAAGKWQAFPIVLRQGRPAAILADFAVQSGSRNLRLELLRRGPRDRLPEVGPNDFLAATASGATGRLRYIVRTPGNYVVLLDNRNSDAQATTAHLRVELDFGEPPGPTVTQLSPLRQLMVILISFAVFFLIVTYSARRLLRGMKR